MMPGFQVRDLGQSSGTFETAPSNADYYYLYTWEVPQIVGYDTKKPGRSYLIHLQSATTPTFTANVEKYIATSVEYKWAKSVTWEDIKLSFYDTVGMMDALIEWRYNVWSPDRGLQPASMYKGTTVLDVYLPNGTAKYGWDLKGSWPSSIRSGELTYADSNVKTVEINLTYDWAEEHVYSNKGTYLPYKDI